MTQSDTHTKSGYGAQKQNPRQRYWQSLDELAESPEFLKKLEHEFPQGAAELKVTSGVGRRQFLSLMSASLGLAGVTSLTTGCIRKPQVHLIPFQKRPEDLIPGKPVQYATAIRVGQSVVGTIVTSTDGRPTKIDGNPLHPTSFGGSNTWLQSNIIELYDNDRTSVPFERGTPSTWESARKSLKNLSDLMKGNAGDGVALVVEPFQSPSFTALVASFQKAFPKAQVFVDDASVPHGSREALKAAGLDGTQAVFALDKADVIASFDADVFQTEGDVIRNQKLFSKGRRVQDEHSAMNRVYAVEPSFTLVGVMADHRLLVKPSEVGQVLMGLAGALKKAGVNVPAALVEKAKVDNETATRNERWITGLAKDLANARGKSVIIVGEKEPAWVHALGLGLNEALGNLGQTVSYVPDETFPSNVQGRTVELAARLASGAVQTLLVVGANPVYAAAGDLKLKEVWSKAPVSVHLGYLLDETSQASTWHIPMSHNLESWGDLRASDGTVTIQQPLIEPLYESLTPQEFLAIVTSGEEVATGLEFLKKHWQSMAGASDMKWKKWLHDGVIDWPKTKAKDLGGNAMGALGGLVAKSADVGPAAPAGSLEVVFPLDGKVYDGRYGNIPWLQELPDTVTKLQWDNAALIAPKTAKDLGVANEDVIEVTYLDRKLEIVVYVTPGTAPGTLVIPLGYGRTFEGTIAKGVGFNANLIRTSAGYQGTGATVKKAGRTYPLAQMQTFHSQEEPFTGRHRPMVREATLEEFKKTPHFVDEMELVEKNEQNTKMWTPPNKRDGVQWGMTIDLNTCTGCMSCSVACQAENNIPTVGKERVIEHREMLWIRIDRYFTGSVDDPQAVTQPVTCMHCENAPCEAVCPVGATPHSPEGLNDMAYNRCIGTRFCSNNCPYKVRRFNYFAFAKENDQRNPLYAMQKNPNVTVRFRGVIEKCTYCVQRINEARIESKREQLDTIPDGRVVTACEQACPTDAITFGDINDPTSRVAKAKKQARNYGMLGELNTQPRTTYLAKLRNTNQELS